MAVDSREKRFSIMTLGNTLQPVSLTPDGTIDQADRQHLLWGYSGILWAAAVVGVIDIFLFNSYITTTASFNSNIETTNNFNSDIETTNSFKSEVK